MKIEDIDGLVRVVYADQLTLGGKYLLKSATHTHPEREVIFKLVDMKDQYGTSINTKQGILSKLFIEYEKPGYEYKFDEVDVSSIFAESPRYELYIIDQDQLILKDLHVEPLKKCKKPFRKILKLSEQDTLKFLSEEGYNTEGYTLGDCWITEAADIYITLNLVECENENTKTN